MDRQSYDDRVCDDLSDVILQYLPLKEKLIIEFVSKQFQRSILLSKHNHMAITQYSFTQNSEKIIKLLKKPYLNKIHLGRCRKPNNPVEISDELIDMIIKNCNNLTDLLISNEQSIGMYAQRELFNRFGQQLISLKILSPNIDFNKATNIEELTLHSIDSKLSQIEFNRLKKLSVMLTPKDFNELDKFIEKNVKTLKHLDIDCISGEDTESDMKRLMTIVTKAKNLVHLGMNLWVGVLKKSFAKYWKEIQINCKQLKSLKVYQTNPSQLSLNEEMFSILKQFKGLKRLNLEFGMTGVLNNQGNLTDEQLDNFRPFQSLKGLDELTHFSIELSIIGKTFSETILTDIEINFPKLQSLSFQCPIDASEWTAQLLCKIKNLEKIALKIKNEEIRPEIERQLIQNCKKLKKYWNNDHH